MNISRCNLPQSRIVMSMEGNPYLNDLKSSRRPGFTYSF